MLAPDHPGDRGEMDDAIAAVKGFPDPLETPHVTVFAAGPEKIQSDDLNPTRFERRAECAADQPLGAGDQNAVARVHRAAKHPCPGALRRVRRRGRLQTPEVARLGLRTLAQDENPRAPIEAIVETSRPAGAVGVADSAQSANSVSAMFGTAP